MHIYIYQVIKIIFILYTGSLIKKPIKMERKTIDFTDEVLSMQTYAVSTAERKKKKKLKERKRKRGRGRE